MATSIGQRDRRITIEVASKGRDASNDEVVVWTPWPKRRWATKRNLRPLETFGAQHVSREADTVFVVRWDSETLTIAPESHRIIHEETIYEIVGIAEESSSGRHEDIKITCCSRPDHQGARGKGAVSEGAP